MKKFIYSIAAVCFILVCFSACATEKTNIGSSTTENTKAPDTSVPSTEIIEGEMPTFDFELKSQEDFDYDKDGWVEKWSVFTAKVNKGFAVSIEAYTPTNALPSGTFDEYRNVFLCDSDSVRLEKNGEDLTLIVSEADESSEYKVSISEKNIVLTNTQTGKLMPYYGDQNKPEGVNQ